MVSFNWYILLFCICTVYTNVIKYLHHEIQDAMFNSTEIETTCKYFSLWPNVQIVVNWTEAVWIKVLSPDLFTFILEINQCSPVWLFLLKYYYENCSGKIILLNLILIENEISKYLIFLYDFILQLHVNMQTFVKKNCKEQFVKFGL